MPPLWKGYLMAELIVEVCKIEKVERHPNADRLDVATVKGWNCIVGRHEFKEGDLCIYIPIDAVLPDELENVLFSGTQVKLKKHRVRTIKLRGVVSQGLVVKPSKIGYDHCIYPGLDVAEDLGITKYEPPVKAMPNHMSGKRKPKKHRHPDFKKYTSINHLKNFPTMLEGQVVSVSEKIHGTNFRCGWIETKPRSWLKKILRFFDWLPKYEFVFGSHNVQLQDGSDKQFYDTNVYARIVKEHNLKERLRPLKGIIFYGEIFGDGIQTGYNYGLGPGEIDVRWFDAFDVRGEMFLSWPVFWGLCTEYKLRMPPILFNGLFDELDIDKYVMGRSRVSKRQRHREGIVIKSHTEFNGHGGRSILKFINPDYLLLRGNSDWH